MTAVDSDVANDAAKSSSPTPARNSVVQEPTRPAPIATIQEKRQEEPPHRSTDESNYTYYASSPPPLDYTIRGVPRRQRAIAIWAILFFIEACILPLVLFYGIRWGTHLSITTNLAIITSLIGTVSGLKMTQRTWYLWYGKGHEHRRPIGAGRWGVDCVHGLIGIAMCAFFIPLIIGSSLSPAQPQVVAMALPCVMIALGLPLLITGLFPNKIRFPIRVSSLPPGQPLPPLVYMYVEDIIAVDGGGGHAFRQAWRTRYEESRVMRQIVQYASIGWGASAVAFGAAFIAIDWTIATDPAYGISYGLPWLWAIASTILTYVAVKRALELERRAWIAPRVHKERILPIEEGKYDRPSLDDVRRRSSIGQRRSYAREHLESLAEEGRAPAPPSSPSSPSHPAPSAPTLPHPPLAHLPSREQATSA